jgi:carboxyl-terminal processing protease
MRGFGIVISLAIVLQAGLFSSAWAAYSPQSLYDDVWKLINSRFVDVNKNQQDWGIWRHRYDKYLETNQDAYLAIETMLASLDDRYTRFLDPDEFAEEGRSIKATLFGIGIQIGTRDDKLLIIAPIEDTPADHAGLKANDEILEIDGKSAKGMSVKDAADIIRGEKGSQVKLVIKRGDNAPMTVPVTRDEIKLKSVSVKTPFDAALNNRYGYIRLSSFLSNNAATEIKTAIKTLGPKEGYIIDLRSNPGGLLSNAITIADDLLAQGSIVSTVDRDGYKEVRHSTPSTITNSPLVVLIDEGSASASEILSGALKDNNRALLVGHRSFGKGLVQEINQLPGGAGINITTQRYLTPNDTDINKTGIQPDLTVDLSDDDIKAKRDPQFMVAVKALEDMAKGRSLKYIIQNKELYAVPPTAVTKAAQNTASMAKPTAVTH